MSSTINKFRNAAYKYVLTKESRKLLPGFYQRQCDEFMTRDPIPVHWRPEEGKFKLDAKSGKRVRIQNVPIKVMYPIQSNKGLWGGEGLVVGFRKKKPLAVRIPTIWRPMLTKRVLYSEILDKHFQIQVTLRTLDLIDEAYGFDHYILKTHEVDLNSQLGMRLKRQMLLTLAQKSLYPDNPKKREKIFKKYEQYVIPEEEAEWVGLTVPEAVNKAKEMHKQKNPVVPLKTLFTQQLVLKLTEEGVEETEGASWATKLNPFASKTSDKS